MFSSYCFRNTLKPWDHNYSIVNSTGSARNTTCSKTINRSFFSSNIIQFKKIESKPKTRNSFSTKKASSSGFSKKSPNTRSNPKFKKSVDLKKSSINPKSAENPLRIEEAEKLTKRLTSVLTAPVKVETAPEVAPEVIEERVAKRIARCGLCSRREAEKWIVDGRVKVDGKLITELGANVRPGQIIQVDNLPIKAEPPKLFLFNKVRQMLITRSLKDERGRETLGQLLDDMGEPTLQPIGRLDFNSEGLLLLTNDGLLKRHLELPQSKLLRVYRVRVYGRVAQSKFDGLENGIEIDGFKYQGVKVTVEDATTRNGKPQSKMLQKKLKEDSNYKYDPANRANTWLRVELQEGKNREIRKIMDYFGLEVSRLIRIQYGPYTIGDIEPGVVIQVPIKPEIQQYVDKTWDWPEELQKVNPATTTNKLKMPKSKPRTTKKAKKEENDDEEL